MKKQELHWEAGLSRDPSEAPEHFFPAKVPGALQADYAAAYDLPPFYEGTNYKAYEALEDYYWRYRTSLYFELEDGETAQLIFKGIDYRFKIFINDRLLHEGEGMFTPVRLPLDAYQGQALRIELLIFPPPKADASQSRTQARESCKPAACYGWDWHPRLLSSGIWDEAYLLIEPKPAIRSFELSYRLSEDLKACRLKAVLSLSEEAEVRARLSFEDETIAEYKGRSEDGVFSAVLETEHPKLWYPRGCGEQNLYRLTCDVLREDGSVASSRSRRIGFRRSRLRMNEGSWEEPRDFPKSRSDAPAQLEINGERVFAKGSNWVNAEVFPGEMTKERYEELLTLAEEAHMNMLRIWGGGFVNKESFYELCDEKGIMVWQEFPLSCNNYPDKDAYLAVLEQEARSIIRRLRSHPCVVLWCGGNELFNNWSGMTEQSHALRLLDKLCYEEDRFTPFIMTSPLNGMAHGHYVNYDETTGREFISDLIKSRNTAYTEFGAPGLASASYIRKFMPEEDFEDCRPGNPVWRAHHGFGAWQGLTWARLPEALYYFGSYENTEDLCKKTAMIQAAAYKSLFEEMRRQQPRCSMALNWCFNEPWPTVGQNNLISWPAEPRPAYYAVQEALRPQLLSARVRRHRWTAGEEFRAELWLLNDAACEIPAGRLQVYYACPGEDGSDSENDDPGSDEKILWGSLSYPAVPPRQNLCLGEICFRLPETEKKTFGLFLEAEGREALNSSYSYFLRQKKEEKRAETQNILNI